MSTRTVLKLFNKTCEFKTGCSSIVSTSSSLKRDPTRSCSLPPVHRIDNNNGIQVQLKKMSKSVENLEDGHRSEENQEDAVQAFSPPVEISRDTAKKFPENIPRIEVEEPLDFEVTDGLRPENPPYDVVNYLRQKTYDTYTRVFKHLQPSCMKPFGSTEEYHQSKTGRKFKLVYPVAPKPRGESVDAGKKPVDVMQTKQFSSYKKEYPGHAMVPRVVVLQPAHQVRTTGGSKKLDSIIGEPNRFRQYTVCTNEASGGATEYITVKLGDLQEECRKEKKCKPKKVLSGRLRKFNPGNCPCVEPSALKEGQPLVRLKKREVKEHKWVCKVDVCPPRADDGFQIKKKTLPCIPVADCPCEARQLVDFSFKRLPKRKVPEPKRSVCVTKVCDTTARSDSGLKITRRKLPGFSTNNCPCVESPPLKDIPLGRLKPKLVKPGPPCKVVDVCAETPRADAGLKPRKKSLPVLKPECFCVDPAVPVDVPPLVRLKKVHVPEPPKLCPPTICDVTLRADHSMVPTLKKLARFEPQPCPCIDIEPPSKTVELKRLEMRNVPRGPEKLCPGFVCPPRADTGMKIPKRKLPVIEMQDCPCVVREQVDVPPLKRLVPKPVVERRVCKKPPTCEEMTRADHGLKISSKQLPKLPHGNCPCVEPIPLKPGKPIVKLTPRPVETLTLPCNSPRECTTSRADENLKIEIKKLPTLKISDCPCYERPPPENVKPLVRLKKIDLPEPVKVCPPPPCEDAVRADVDDWMYYKKVAVHDCTEQKREYSTFSPMALKGTNPVSTCSKTLGEQSIDWPPPESPHLQPRKPIIPERESFIKPYPDDAAIAQSARKSRMYERTSPKDVAEETCPDEAPEVVVCEEQAKLEEPQSVWEKILNYFKARPDCPTPEEFRGMRLKETAEKAAAKAGLCLYDPKENLHKTEELPKVITSDDCRKKC